MFDTVPQFSHFFFEFCISIPKYRRSQWPRGLKRRSAAARLLGMRVRIPPGTWLSVSCECSVLSGTGLCVGLITRSEIPYRVWCVWVCEWSLDNEQTPANWGLFRHKQNAEILWHCVLISFQHKTSFLTFSRKVVNVIFTTSPFAHTLHLYYT